MKLLNDEQIKNTVETKNLSDWKLSAKEIERQFTLKDFVSSVKLVNKVAEAAEEMQHHPDIKIEYNKITFTLSTHSEGGLTKLDFELAEKINKFATELS